MNKKFPLILKNLRTGNAYTQKELAKLLNLGQTTIANYEKGSRIPDIYKLEQIANLFDVSIDYLIGRHKITLEKYVMDYKKKANYSDKNYKIYIDHLIKGNKYKALDLCLSLLSKGEDISKIYEYIIAPSLIKTGDLWEKGIIDIWQEHLISEMSQDIMSILHSKFNPKEKNNKTIIGLTPGPEIHNIGLKMVCSVFELAGWNSIYLGSNIPTKNILNAISEKKPDIVALSITMSQHRESADNIIQAIRKVHSKDSLSIILGGSGFKPYNGGVKLKNANYFFENLDDLVSHLDEIV